MGPATAGEQASALLVLRDELAAETGLGQAVVLELEGTDSDLFGRFVATGPRAVESCEYAILIEAIREGYLLHYGSPRLFVSVIDPDLALLAGDFLYALGLERLSRLSNLEAVHELSDLISLQAVIHSDGPPFDASTLYLASALWLGVGVAVAFGGNGEFEALKAEIPEGRDLRGLSERILAWADARVGESGVNEAWTRLREQVGFGNHSEPPSLD